jgi:amino acid permease
MTATEGDIEKKVSPAVQPASSSDVAPPAYGESGPVEDIEAGTLKRHLKGRHMQMIAIGMN